MKLSITIHASSHNASEVDYARTLRDQLLAAADELETYDDVFRKLRQLSGENPRLPIRELGGNRVELRRLDSDTDQEIPFLTVTT